MDNTEDDINRLKLAADLRLIGFPCVQNENLFESFTKIAAIIGYDTSLHISVPMIERVPIRNRLTGLFTPSATILLHLTSVQVKQYFYSLYLGKMPIKPEAFGLPSEHRIILGENLTAKNAFLFKKAQNMRNDNKIAQVFTIDGIVKIKFAKGPNHNAFTVRNSLELECLVAQQQSMETDGPNITPLAHSNVSQQHKEQQPLESSFEMLPGETVTQAATSNAHSNGPPTPANGDINSQQSIHQ